MCAAAVLSQEKLVRASLKRERLKRKKPKITVRPPTGEGKKREEIQAELDRILNKISREGMESLTKEEEELLDEASRLYKEQ